MALKTTKTRLRPRKFSAFDATMLELKHDAQRGLAYFWGRRPHLHRPGGLGRLDFGRHPPA